MRAIEVFKKAESMADIPILQLHLGLTCLKMYQVIEARDALEKALQDGARSCQKRIKNWPKKP